MKFIYLHCGEETNIRDLAAKNTTELVVEIRPEKKFFNLSTTSSVVFLAARISYKRF